MQFTRTLTKRDLKKLEFIGADVEDYLTNNTFVVRVRQDTIPPLRKLGFVAGLEEIDWRDKVSQALYRGWISQEAILPGGLARVRIGLGATCNVYAASGCLQAQGAIIRERADRARQMVVALPESAVAAVAALANVRFIEEWRRQERGSIRSGVMSEAYWYRGANLHGLFDLSGYLLDGYLEIKGEAIVVGMRDGAPVKWDHQGLQGRILYSEGEAPPFDPHVTPMAAIIAGNVYTTEGGQDVGGQAPGALLVCYSGDDSNFYSGDLSELAEVWGSAVINNVYQELNCGGEYTASCNEVDGWMTRGSHRAVTVLTVAGNYGDRDLYGSVAPPGTAKNVITVGSVYWNPIPKYPESAPLPGTWDVGIDRLSGAGPCGDGRIKPDLVARGDHVLTAKSDGTYEDVSGTCAAVAVATGASTLVIEAFEKTYGFCPTSDIVKAILCNTALDQCSGWTDYREDRPGPDYRYGFGLLKAKAAAQTVYRDLVPGYKPGGGHILTGVIEETGDEVEFTAELSDANVIARDLRVTLTWIDPAAALSAEAALVNDLDLELVSPDGTVYYPFSLDRDHPDLDATAEGANTLDNIEQVLVDGPITSGFWTFRINAAQLPNRTQEFALVSSAGFDKVSFLDCNVWDGANWRSGRSAVTGDPTPTLRVAVSSPIARLQLTGDHRPSYAISMDGTEINPDTAEWHDITGAYSDPACPAGSEIQPGDYNGLVYYLKLEEVGFDQLSRTNNRVLVRVYDDSGQPPHDSPSYVVRTATDRYVSLDGSDEDGDGSREYPFRSISRALEAMGASGDENDPVTIRVAPGTYNECVTIKENVRLYGGCDPNHLWMSKTSLQTTIEADGENPAVKAWQLSGQPVLEGFTIRGGKPGVDCYLSSPIIRKCVIRANSHAGAAGGGVCVRGYVGDALACPVFEDCVIQENTAQEGAGMACLGQKAQPLVLNTMFRGNHAIGSAGRGGAVLANYSAHVRLINCTIVDNHCDGSGAGGVECTTGFMAGSATITNCILWGNGNELENCQATYSCIEGGGAGQGNTSADPLFVDADGPDNDPDTYDDNNYHLSAQSPCIDAGTNGAEGLPEADFEGDPRRAMGPEGGIVDMGADEYYWTRSVLARKTPAGIEVSWDCIWGITEYRVDYAEELSMDTTWSTFPGIIDGTGLERASYLDTTAGPEETRFYRVREYE